MHPFYRLCDKANCMPDGAHVMDAEWMMARLRRYKAGRGYSVATVKAIIDDYKAQPPARNITSPDLQRRLDRLGAQLGRAMREL